MILLQVLGMVSEATVLPNVPQPDDYMFIQPLAFFMYDNLPSSKKW